MKPIKFKRIEIRKPRTDPNPDKSKTNNSDWRVGLFVVFEDYKGNEFDWMPKWTELDKITGGRLLVESANAEMCNNYMKGGKA